MNIREIYELAKQNFNGLISKAEYVNTNGSIAYKFNNLSNVRQAIINLEHIEFLRPQIIALKSSNLFATVGDVELIDSANHTVITSNLESLKTGLNYIVKQFEFVYAVENENSIVVKLPPIKSFDDLAKVANELKKAIEIPIADAKIESDVAIVGTETGSIWFEIALGSAFAVNLVGGICWSAAVIRKKRAEAKMFEAHVNTLELKNDSLTVFIAAQKTQIANILQNEAEAIATKHYSASDPEVINRLKLSISTVADLMDRGTKVLTTSKDDLVKEKFPDYDKMPLIQSAIKQIQEN